jgi:hypothetical protein
MERFRRRSPGSGSSFKGRSGNRLWRLLVPILIVVVPIMIVLKLIAV